MLSSLLILGLFLIFLALLPNFKVDIVSSSLNLAGLQVIISAVLELPPNDSYKILVSLESRYGTWVDLPSVKLLITKPNVLKDLLIIFASSSV